MYNAYIMESVARERMEQAHRATSRGAGRRTDGRVVSNRRSRVTAFLVHPLRDRLA